MEKNMKLLCISDLHGNIEVLDKLESEFKNSDAVLFAGDFAKFGDTKTGLPALEKLTEKHQNIFAVLGNCDKEDFLAQIEDADVSCQKSLVFHEGLLIAGCGGGTKFTGTTPYERTEEEIISDYKTVVESASESGELGNLILIMHNPPKDTECDKVAPTVHVGSQMLREFVEQYKPILVVTGHIHESKGVDKIGETTVLNPGALLEGSYSVVTLTKDGDQWKVDSVELKSI